MQLLLLIALLLTAAALAYYVLCLFCVVAFFRAARKSPLPQYLHRPLISILKPVRGLDRDAYQNFASFCGLDYPAYELLFAVADPDDPVLATIEKLKNDFPDCSIRLIQGVTHVGANKKVNSLCQLVREAKYDLVVMSDSDVRVEPDYLQQIAQLFADPKVGAVTAFYRCVSGGSFTADLDAIGMYLDSVPGALAARWVEKRMQFAFGWTLATTKGHLAEIGGLEAIANHHSDDFELGNRIASRGYRVELIHKPVSMVFPKETFRQFILHELRWSIGLKNVRPVGYFALIFTHGLAWSVLAAAIAVSMGWTGLAVGTLLAYLVLRLALLWTTAIWGLRDCEFLGRMWLAPLRDAITFSVWLAGFFSNTIVWRGLVYRVKNGRLLPIKVADDSSNSPFRIGIRPVP